MAINFPDNPVLDETFTYGTTTWKFDGSRWIMFANSFVGLQGIQGMQGVQGTFGPATTPITSVTSYTATLSDVGKTISVSSGGVTIPASVFSPGDNFIIFNNSVSEQTIVQDSGVTLRLAGTESTGNRALAKYGIATVLCIEGGANPTIVIAGTGLS